MTGFFIILAILWIVGLGLMAHGVFSARNSKRAASWPTVPVTFNKLEVKEEIDEGTSSYKVVVDYFYVVVGVQYQSTRLAFGYGDGGDRESADKMLQRLKGASIVETRYDPGNPGSAVLTFGLHRGISMRLVFATMWLVFLGGISVMAWLTLLFPNSAAVSVAIGIAVFAGIALFNVGTALMFWLYFRENDRLLKNLKIS